MARKGGRKRRGGLGLDAYLSFAIFGAVGLATWPLGQLLRMTLLWLALLAVTLVYASGRRIEVTYTVSGIGRGAVAGLLISLPATILVRDFLLATSQRLFPVDSAVSLLWGLVLVMPAVEALYFRGLLQREKGLWPSVLLYAAAGAIYFLPSTLADYLPVLAALVGVMAVLGFVYSYVRALYGFAASLACQGIVHFVLFVAPLWPQELPGFPP